MRKKTSVLLKSGIIIAMTLCLTACNKKDKNSETTTSGSGVTEAQTGSTAAAEPIKQTSTVADYSPYITVGQYTGLDIAVDAAVVTDQQIQEYKDSLVEYYNTNLAQGEPAEGAVTKIGDVINLNYSGLLDGTAFSGGTAENQRYTIGGTEDTKFIDDLDTQLAGLEVGKEYELPCRFPETYGNTELAGKDVIFVVTVNWIAKKYEWGDELINLYTNGEYTTAEAYEEYVTNQMLAEAQERQRTEYQGALWEQISAASEVKSYPEEKVNKIAEEYISYYTEYYTYYASMYGMDMASFLSAMFGMTEDDLKSDCQQMAVQEVTYIMVACEIYKALGRTLSDEEYNERAAATAQQQGYESAAAFVESYGEEYVRESFIFDIVNEYLTQNNNMVINE